MLLACCLACSRKSARGAAGPRLSAGLESELSALHARPSEAIGWGGKATLPYVLRVGDGLALGGPTAVTRLIREALDDRRARVDRLALLHVIGYSTAPSADDALIQALRDPALRPLAAYLLGRVNRAGYPERRRDRRAILAALRPYLEDVTAFVDPWYPEVHPRAGDLALAAFLAVADPTRFAHVGVGPSVGLGIAQFDASRRAELLPACWSLDIDGLSDQQAGER